MFLRPQATGCPARHQMLAHWSGASQRHFAAPQRATRVAERAVAPPGCRKARPHGAEEKPYGRVCYLSPKARHTVGTHTGTKPNSRHLPQVTASKPSSGQPAAGSGTNRRFLEGCANRLGGVHQVTQRLLGLLVITSLQTTVRVHPQVSNGAVTNRSLQQGLNLIL